jgi:hypothetical protein
LFVLIGHVKAKDLTNKTACIKMYTLIQGRIFVLHSSTFVIPLPSQPPSCSVYLSDRYQRVVVNNEHLYSDWGKIKNGVPHGSILGPLLFLLYINDLPNTISSKSKPVLFEDDTSIIITNSRSTDHEINTSQIFKNINDCLKLIY